jgi:hypothetical protein
MDDARQIENALNRALAIYDSGDIEGYAASYRHATLVWFDGTEVSGPEPVLAERREYHAKLPSVKHIHAVSNVQIEVSEDRASATSLSYVTAYRQVADGPMRLTYHGLYRDEWGKIDGIWWLTRRQPQPIWVYPIADDAGLSDSMVDAMHGAVK